MIPTAILINTH